MNYFIYSLVALNRSYDDFMLMDGESIDQYISSEVFLVISDIDCLNLATFLPLIYC